MPVAKLTRMKSTTLKIVALALFTVSLVSCATQPTPESAQKKENRSGLANVMH